MGEEKNDYLLREAKDVLDSQKRISNWVFQKKDGSRRDSLSSAWVTMKKRAGIENHQLKDFRNWFNHHLKHELQFTTKEAASYLGHCPKVNETHYEPISKERMTLKLNSQSLTATNLL